MAQSFLRGVDFKKAEITALREALQDALNKRDVAAQIEVMKHVIQAMTSGSDVSELMEIVMMVSHIFFPF
jgi:vesicle coat complex subunit